MIISKTCYRISILGGGNDSPDFYSKYGSYIIGFGLNYHVYVMVNFMPKLDDIHYQAFYSFPEKVSNINDFKNPAIRGSLIFLKMQFPDLENIAIHVNNTLPSRTGIGSSSSLIVGILNAVYKLKDKKISKDKLANYTNHIEREILCEPGGRQDPFWASFGNIGSLEFEKNGKISYKTFNLSENFIEEFKKSSIIFYYSQRESFEVSKTYKNDSAEKYKLRLLEIAKEGKVAFEDENLDEIKSLLEANWQEKRQISNLISSPEIDNIHDILKSKGASMKVCGSGGGGMIYCLCDPSTREDIINTMKLPTLDVDFDLDGSQII